MKALDFDQTFEEGGELLPQLDLTQASRPGLTAQSHQSATGPVSTIKFSTPIWQHTGPGGWWFLTLPVDLSEELRSVYSHLSPGWGSLPVNVTVGGTSWKTSIFFDRSRGAFLLPMKSEVRKREKLVEGSSVEVLLEVN